MSGKYMKVKRIIIPTITMILLASQLMACGATTQSEMLQMINRNEAIEIEIATPVNAEQGTESELTWTELALLVSNPDLRATWEQELGISGSGLDKNGMFYVDAEGNHVTNNTLSVVLRNEAVVKALENQSEELALAAINNYADLDAENMNQALMMGINSYFNLLSDSQPNYCNPDSTLDRSEFMAMVMRADTPVDNGMVGSTAFNSAVGKSDYNLYAQKVVSNSYLDTASKSLNNQTYNATISRAEAVYMVVSRYFADDLKSVDLTATTYADIKDGGDIATAQKFIENNVKKDYWKSYELSYAIQNPDGGAPTDLYKAMIVAYEKGLLPNTDCRWDEGLTKSEGIELIVNTFKAIGTSFNSTGAELSTVEVETPSDTSGGSMGSADLADMPVEPGDEEYVDTGSDVVEEPETTETTVEAETGIVIVEELDQTMYPTSNCNARSGDTTDYEKVAYLEKGASLHVTGKTANGWYRVEWDNIEGNCVYVSGKLLSTTKPAASKPSTSNNQQTPSQPSQSALEQAMQQAAEAAGGSVGNNPEWGTGTGSGAFKW